jgi:hypothetical protein
MVVTRANIFLSAIYKVLLHMIFWLKLQKDLEVISGRCYSFSHFRHEKGGSEQGDGFTHCLHISKVLPDGQFIQLAIIY